ncbi:MAG: type II toxin-antitoxin system HipA family toxin YjjJ, partial [Gammaproteobacteria bacterium]
NRFIMADTLSTFLKGRGTVGAAELRTALKISPATLSRLTTAEAGSVLTLGRGRATRYALPRPVAGLSPRLPVYRVNTTGHALHTAELVALQDGGSWLGATRGGGHAFAGLPPVIHDMAPAGYLGRRFAARHPDLKLPNRLQDWNDDQRLIAVARRGEDCPGDLIIGEESLERFFAWQPLAATDDAYPRLAAESAALGAGSSVAGEQPKFNVFRDGRHCLVKFSPGDGSPSDERWRDLLACEVLALETLAGHGLPASRGRILDAGRQRFLEVERFDRIGARGRRGVLMLGPLDDDLFGARDSWTEAAARLHAARLLSESDARWIRLFEAFGILISNGDRHFGNISFFADGLQLRPKLQLAPAYDMLPMDAAPQAGVLPVLPDQSPTPRAKLMDVWEEAGRFAAEFWQRVTQDTRINDAYRRMAEAQVRTHAD